MLVDCDTCTVRGPACGDCVVAVLLGAPPAASGDGAELDRAERAAIAVLAGSGLVPPLRLLATEGRAPSGPAGSRGPSGGAGGGEASAARPDCVAAQVVNRPSPPPHRPSTHRAVG